MVLILTSTGTVRLIYWWGNKGRRWGRGREGEGRNVVKALMHGAKLGLELGYLFPQC